MTDKKTPANALVATPVKTRSDVVYINIALPRALHRKLRVKQIDRDMPTLGDAVREAVEAWVKVR